MDCPHCGKPLTYVYRGLVVTSFVAHPVEGERVNIDAVAEVETTHREEELHDGEYGVFYRCPECEGDIDLFDDEGEPTGPEGEMERNVLATLQWVGEDTPEDCLADEMSLTVEEIKDAVDALIGKGLIEQDTLPESHGEPRNLTAVEL